MVDHVAIDAADADYHHMLNRGADSGAATSALFDMGYSDDVVITVSNRHTSFSPACARAHRDHE